MKIITTTKARQNMREIINRVKYKGETFGIGRRNSIDAIITPAPKKYYPEFDEITNILSGTFDFLKDEPDIYSVKDLKKIYKWSKVT